MSTSWLFNCAILLRRRTSGTAAALLLCNQGSLTVRLTVLYGLFHICVLKKKRIEKGKKSSHNARAEPAFQFFSWQAASEEFPLWLRPQRIKCVNIDGAHALKAERLPFTD